MTDICNGLSKEVDILQAAVDSKDASISQLDSQLRSITKQVRATPASTHMCTMSTAMFPLVYVRYTSFLTRALGSDSMEQVPVLNLSYFQSNSTELS